MILILFSKVIKPREPGIRTSLLQAANRLRTFKTSRIINLMKQVKGPENIYMSNIFWNVTNQKNTSLFIAKLVLIHL